MSGGKGHGKVPRNGLIMDIEDPDERQAAIDKINREFKELKAEYADDENVHIFASDDYELDESVPSPADPTRGIDGEKIRKAARERGPVPEGIDIGVDGPVILRSDVHSQEDIDSFVETARTTDPVTGRVWEDPMPASDFDTSLPDENIHFRTNGGTLDFEDEPVDAEEVERILMKTARKRRKTYETEEELFAELTEMLDKDAMEKEIEMETWEVPDPPIEEVPDPEDFSKWQAAVDARGGNSSRQNSFSLSPAKRETGFDRSMKEDVRKTYSEVTSQGYPDQYSTLVDTHVGEWSGVLSLFSIFDNLKNGSEESDPQKASAPAAQDHGDDLVLNPAEALISLKIRTIVSTDDNAGELRWRTTAIEALPEGELPDSTVTFAREEDGEGLLAGRSVFENGSYVRENYNDEGKGEDPQGPLMVKLEAEGSERSEEKQYIRPSATTVPSALLSKLARIANPDASPLRGTAEICDIRIRDAVERHRVIFCTTGGELTHIAAICDVSGTGKEARTALTSLLSTSASLGEFVGEWKGSGTSLHPQYPPFPVSEVLSHSATTVLHSAPSPREVTYRKEDPSSSKSAMRMMDPDKARDARSNKEGIKLSKRVTTALRHDEKRLEDCRILCSETLNDAMAEVSAWEVRQTSLFSPRLGPWVPNYYALALPGGALVIGPMGPWAAGVRSRLDVMLAAADGCRQHVIISRNSDGEVTGAAHVLDRLDVENEVDEDDEDDIVEDW